MFSFRYNNDARFGKFTSEEEESERFCYCYLEIWKLPGIGRNYEWFFYGLIKGWESFQVDDDF